MNKTPEEINKEDYLIRKKIIDEFTEDCQALTGQQRNVVMCALHEYGKQRYNQAIKDAAENAKAFEDDEITYPYLNHPGMYHKKRVIKVDKDSILKLLKP